MSIRTDLKSARSGYFLPYLDKETGWKKYCEVSGSKMSPEKWGEHFKIPNYFLIEALFN